MILDELLSAPGLIVRALDPAGLAWTPIFATLALEVALPLCAGAIRTIRREVK